VAEGARLESELPVKSRYEGSNPSRSVPEDEVVGYLRPDIGAPGDRRPDVGVLLSGLLDPEGG
jgi:hypothetical protein